MSDFYIKNRKLIERMLGEQIIVDQLEGMGLDSDQKLIYLSLCYNLVVTEILNIERAEGREPEVITALVAALQLVKEGKIFFEEDEQTHVIRALKG